MKTVQYCWNEAGTWEHHPAARDVPRADLILVFGSAELIRHGPCIGDLQAAFPEAKMIGCSTAGEIMGTAVSDNRLIATVISFRAARVAGGYVSILDYPNSAAAAKALVERMDKKGIRHLFVLADGMLTNGSEIVRGLNEALPPGVTVTGGLAGDGMRFVSTFTVFDGVVREASIAAIGFYGESLRFGFGSCGGWIPFGPERLITASEGNTLFELDGQSALELYTQYLGKEAENLPAAGLLFPLAIQNDEHDAAVVRTIMVVDEQRQSLSFAGDMPLGCYARFMRAVPDDLIDGAAQASAISEKIGGAAPELCILISCVGRKAVLQQLTEEETEIVAERYGTKPVMTGFYSYGEIAPFRSGEPAILHNQTMTITTISEE